MNARWKLNHLNTLLIKSRNYLVLLLLMMLSFESAAIVISSPASGSSFVVGNTINFVADSEGALCGNYSWAFGGAATDVTVNAVGTDISTSITPSNVGTYTIQLSANGCETVPPPVTLVISVNANVIPTATINTPNTGIVIQAGASLNFTGTGSDSDSSGALSYSWNFGGAGTSTLEDPGVVTFSTAGTYTVVLTVTDSDGGSDTDTISVVVNEAPVANAGPDQSVNEQLAVNLDASASDDGDGTIASYSWTQTVGTTVTLANSTTITPSFTSPTTTATETLTFQVTVTDNEGGTATDVVSITVNAVNADPIANAGVDQSVNEQITVNLSGLASDDSDGSISSYSWTQASGTAVTLANTTTATPSFTSPTTTATETLNFQVTVTDNEGGSATDAVSITVNAVNADPIANAGSDQGVNEQSTVNLNGSASVDNDGTIASYSWTQTVGPAVILNNSATVAPNFTAPTVSAIETLIFELAVIDNEGGSSTDTVSVTLNAVNATPTANAGLDQGVNEQVTVNLDGSASDDSDGAIVLYSWSQTAGTAVTLNNAATITPSFTAPTISAIETLIFELTVTDNEGGSSTDTVSVTLNAVNVKPTANAGLDQGVNEQVAVNLDGSASDDSDGTIVLYSWSQTAGTAVTLNNAATATPSFTAPTVSETETLLFELTVTDNEGGSSTDTVSVTMSAVNATPTTNAGMDQNIDEEVIVNLDGSASDDSDGTIASYSWTQTAGTVVILNNAATATPSFTAPTVSETETLTFELTITDDEGVSSTDTVDITVTAEDANPEVTLLTATIDTPEESVSIEVGGGVSFSGTGSSTNEENLLSYSWNFDGGADDTIEQNPGEVLFHKAGKYTVTFTVRNDLGGVGRADITVSVGQADSTDEKVVEKALKDIASTPNETSVSEVLAEFCTQGGSEENADCLDLAEAAVNGNTTEVANALDQITMDEVSAPLDAIASSAGVTNNNINMRLGALRSGVSGVSLTGLNLIIPDQGQLPVGLLADGYTVQSGGGAGDEIESSQWGVFINGSISVGDKEDTKKEAGYDFDTKGLTLGVDYRLSDSRVIGGAFSFGMMDTDLNSDGGDIQGSNYSLLIYGTQYSEQYYVDGSISYGWSRFDQGRNINYSLSGKEVKQSLSSEYDGGEFVMTVGGGYQFNRGALTFGPVARLEYMSLSIDAFEENVDSQSGSGWAMAIEKQTQETLNTSLSGQADYAISLSWGVLIPSVQIDWTHEFKGDDRVVNGQFVGDASDSSFSLKTDVEDSDYFNLGLGVSTQLPHDKSAFFFYQTLLGKSDVTQHNYSLGFRWAF